MLKKLAKLDGFFDNDGVVECVGTHRDSLDGTICGFVGKDSRVYSTPRLSNWVNCMFSVSSLDLLTALSSCIFSFEVKQ